MALKDWSITAGSNTGILSGLTLDGAVMTVPQLDNAFRDMAAQLASQVGKVGFKGADIASASTTNLATATGWFVDITGTTTITAFGTVDAGQIFMLRFTGALTLTHNASSLILPGGASFTTAANDVAFMMSLGSGNWHCINYQQATTASVTITPPSAQVFTGNGTWTKPANCTRIVIEAVGGGGGSGGINGVAAASGATGGGGSGFYGQTIPLDVSAVVSAAVTIGAAGIAGDLNSNGGSGGSTSITIGATTYTWGGGAGSTFLNAGANGGPIGGAGGAGTNVVGTAQQGGTARYVHADLDSAAGAGGGTPLGTGGLARRSITSGASGGGLSGSGFGSGASGAFNVNVNADQAGAAGTAGYMRIWEYYS